MLLYYFQIIIFDTWLVYFSFKNLTLEAGESDVKQHLLLLSVLGRHRHIMIYFAFFFLQFCWVLFVSKTKMKVGTYSDIWFLEIWGRFVPSHEHIVVSKVGPFDYTESCKERQ